MLADRMRQVSSNRGIVLPEVGEPFMGGFYVGIIDTTRDNIIPNDAYQDGLRYALIVSPQSLEGGRDTGTGDLRWHASGSQTVAGAQTRWDGLSATAALAGSAFEAAAYCRGLTPPSDDASEWYLPALDELEMVYRRLKPSTADNYTTDRTDHDFPGGTQQQGHNPSSDPTGSPYTASDPAQTSLADFQENGPEALSTAHYCWTATWFSNSLAWYQDGATGRQGGSTQTHGAQRVRPVRRLPLS